MTVSVIIPTFNSATLGLTLASIAAQDYPPELVEVIVVDDGSTPSVELGEHVPPRTRVIRVEQGWGRSNAAEVGIGASTGDIIYWLDADMILFRDNIREHAKWAHFIPDAATIGEKGFVLDWDLTPGAVAELVASGEVSTLWDFDEREPHWSVGVFASTDDLNDSDGRNYSTHMGACATVTRAVLEAAGGQDTRLHLGEDTEIAYRIWQAGGVFIPARTARAWHLGPATISTHLEAVQHINDVAFAQRMPIPRYRRSAESRVWEVPLVQVVVGVDEESAAAARTCVDLILNSTLSDVRVTIVGAWDRLSDERRRVLADPLIELRLLREWFDGDGRVSFSTDEQVRTFPSPYSIELSPYVGLGPDSLRELVREIDTRRVGIVSYAAPAPDLGMIEIWDGAAMERARRHAGDAEPLARAVDRVWGSAMHDEALSGAVDLRVHPRPDRIVSGYASEASAARSAHDDCRRERDSARTDLREARADLREVRAELRTTRASLDAARAELVEAQASISELRDRGAGRVFRDAARASWRRRFPRRSPLAPRDGSSDEA